MKKIVLGDCFRGDYQPILVVDDNHGSVDRCYLLSDLAGRSMYMLDDEILKREPLPTLHLPIKKEWFDLILSGVKKQEYRDVSDFYCRRLLIGKRELEFQSWEEMISDMRNFSKKPRHESMGELFEYWDILMKDFKVIHLTNGYGNHCRQLWAKIESITVGKGNPEWGAPDCDVFRIHLGEVFHTKNVVK